MNTMFGGAEACCKASGLTIAVAKNSRRFIERPPRVRTVGAVYDRPIVATCFSLGGHRPPLQLKLQPDLTRKRSGSGLGRNLPERSGIDIQVRIRRRGVVEDIS